MVSERRRAVDPRVIVLLLFGALILSRYLPRFSPARPYKIPGAVFWISCSSAASGFYRAGAGGGSSWFSLYKLAGFEPPATINLPWPPPNFSAYKIASFTPPKPVVLPPDAAPFAFQPIPLNTASPELLTIIPGVGKHLAAEIVRYRQKNGPLQNLSDLEKIRGIGPGKGRIIAGYVRF